MIVKIQLPLYSTEPNPDALITSEDGSIETLMPVNLVTKIMHGRPKAYFKARLVRGILHIDKEVKERVW